MAWPEEVRQVNPTLDESRLRSALAGECWPALPAGLGALALALAYQLEQSQWWPRERLERAQFRQLAAVLEHAARTVPWYRHRFAAAGVEPGGDWDDVRWRSLPLLTRTDLQDAHAELRSRAVPAGHGRTLRTQTSGSTGEPVQVCVTDIGQLYWRALTLRDHQWHRRDLGAKLCAIRVTDPGVADGPDGLQRAGWGAATDAVYRTGPMALLDLSTDIAVQARWLEREDPVYLLSYPSNLDALADVFAGGGRPLPNLRGIRTVGEQLNGDVRARVESAFGAPIVDSYSTQEVGYVALQCPSGSGLYHVQSEALRVEVLREDGEPCMPGEIGRVVVSTLHNFAMPLIRYDLRDYAEVGAPCSCGRGLPSIARILGRRRNMLVLPDGSRRWPLVGFARYRHVAPVRQYQIVQRSLSTVLARLVVERPLDADECARLAEVIRDALRHPFRIEFEFVDALARGPGGKFEDFVSEVER
ncbi:MAG: phenylacetate--CoA ligase family protein [Gammaproteobacteria bacterium]